MANHIKALIDVMSQQSWLPEKLRRKLLSRLASGRLGHHQVISYLRENQISPQQIAVALCLHYQLPLVKLSRTKPQAHINSDHLLYYLKYQYCPFAINAGVLTLVTANFFPELPKILANIYPDYELKFLTTSEPELQQYLAPHIKANFQAHACHHLHQTRPDQSAYNRFNRRQQLIIALKLLAAAGLMSIDLKVLGSITSIAIQGLMLVTMLFNILLLLVAQRSRPEPKPTKYLQMMISQQ